MRRITAAYLFALTACGGGPAPAPATASAPRASASTSEISPSSAPAAVAMSAPAPESPFNVIGEIKDEVRLYGAGERGFVAADGGIVFSLIGDDVVHDPLIQRGFSEDPMFGLAGITGVWPDRAWLSTTHPAGRSGFTKLWTWNGKRWASKQSTSESRFIAGIRPWTGGRMLAIEQAGMLFDAEFRVVSGDKNAVVPAFTRRPNPQSFCYTELQAQAFETLPSGEIFVAGPRCNDEEVTGVAVERWAPGQKKGVLESLPSTSVAGQLSQNVSPSIAIAGMAVRSATDVLVAAERDTFYSDTKKREVVTHFAHFDGSRWTDRRSPVPGLVKSLSAASDGTLFVTNDRGELYSGSTLDALALVPLPAELSGRSENPHVVSIWSRAPGDVWAIVAMLRDPKSGEASGHFLLHTRPATGNLPSVDEFQQKERAYRLPGPPVDWCATPFVLLYTLGKKAPADYDYPSTRTALRGHKEFGVEGVEFLEFERMGTRFFGARVPDFSLGKKLATLVKEKVPGSTPELVCHDPPPLRTLTMDLTPAKN